MRMSIKAAAVIAALAAVSGQTSKPRSLSYQVEYRPAAHDSAAGRLSFYVTYDAPSKRTVFDIPNKWADQSELYKAIDSLKLITPGTLDTTNIKDGKIAVTSTTSRPVVLHYVIRQDWEGPIARAHYFRAIVQPRFFLVLGQNALIIPQTAAKLQTTIHWTVPAGTAIATSWGNGAEQRALLSEDELRNGVYAGGQLHEVSATVANAQFTLLSADASWTFPPEQLLANAAKVVNAERAFWKESGKAHYLLTLLPSVNDEGGTRYNNAMTLFVDPKYTLDQYTPLIAHESFHEWLGGRIPQKAGDREMLTKWFAEGFTDYFGDRIAYDSGLLSAADYADRINNTIRRYYLSPARNATSERIASEYWTNTDVNRISYERGRLFAVRLNREIARATNGAKSIDDLMRVVLKLVPDSMLLSDSAVAKAGQRVAGGTIQNEIEKYIGQGTILQLQSDALGKCFTMDTASVAVFDLGFDWDKSKASKRITGTTINGPAYNAGIRDGMELKGMNFYGGDATRDASFTVADASGEKKVSYRPVRADSARLPEFKPKICK